MTRWPASGALLVLVAGLAGCGAGTALGSACLPQPLAIDPAEVPAGGTATLSSRGFDCDASYPDGHEYGVSLLLLGRQDPLFLGEVPVAEDGSFRAPVTIPADATPGEGAVSVTGSPYDDCPDTPGTSCAGYVVDLTVLPPG